MDVTNLLFAKKFQGHSPFRPHKTKDKHEIDKMTMNMLIELPEAMESEVKNLLELLLHRDVEKRLGCMGQGAVEVREHPFFKDVDWKQVNFEKITFIIGPEIQYFILWKFRMYVEPESNSNRINNRYYGSRIR